MKSRNYKLLFQETTQNSPKIFNSLNFSYFQLGPNAHRPHYHLISTIPTTKPSMSPFLNPEHP